MIIEDLLDLHLFPSTKVLFVEDTTRNLPARYRSKYVDAYACSKDNAMSYPFFYNKEIEKVNFPTDYFDTVVYFGSFALESVGLTEAFRIVKQINKGGKFILHVPSRNVTGRAVKILEELGFAIENASFSKTPGTIVIARKTSVNRPKLILPPGIGDSYWVLVKLQSFLRENNLGLPDVYVVGRADNQYGTHARSFSFLEMFPFINCTWEYIDYDYAVKEIGRPVVSQQLWIEANEQAGRSIFPGLFGSDYFFCYNGCINNSVTLEAANPEYSCNWYPPMFTSLHQDRYMRESIAKYGNYILLSFAFRGTFLSWAEQFPVEAIIQYAKLLAERTNFKIILTGGLWDAVDVGLNHIADNTDCVNLMGKTTVEELFGLIRGSKCVVGYPSGLIMMAPVLGGKSLSLWNDYYPEATSWNVVPPDSRNVRWFVEKTAGLSVKRLVSKTVEVVGIE